MNKKMNPKAIAIRFLEDIATLEGKKKCKKDKFEKMKFACDAMRFLIQGEGLWRENKFAEADVKFREGREFIKENLHTLDKNQDSVEHPVIELISYDLRFLSEAVLFDREFQSIFQAKNFKELKIRINFILELAKRNMSKEVPHYPPLQAVFAMKMRYFCMLTEAVLGESFKDNIKDKSDIKKSFHTFQKINFKMAKESLEAIDDFLIALKDAVHKHGGLVFIPLQEESDLMKILQRGLFQEKTKFDKEKEFRKHATEEVEYRVWYKESEPKGKPIRAEEKEDKVKNAKVYDLLIIREETHTQVFIDGKKSKRPPGKLAYRILAFVLKHKGSGGTAWSIAQHVWSKDFPLLFEEPRELAKAVIAESNIKKARELQGKIDYWSNRARRRIADLNKYFLKKLNTKLEAIEMDEYELTPKIPNYCLIEKV